MEAVRFLKRQIRKQPALVGLLQGPSVRATVALRRLNMWRWYGTRRLSIDRMNDWIAERIRSGSPSAIGKMGTLELELLAFDSRRGGDGARRPVPRELRQQAYVNVGLFPVAADQPLWRALDVIRAALGSLDGMAVNGKLGERELVEGACTSVRAFSETLGLEPWSATRPWTAALAGKRVLIVHPFVGTVRAQFENARTQIWRARPEILPEFELQTLRVPLSPALMPPLESDWNSRLERLKAELDRRRFDVALIGAGGMSLPLAAHAKSLGAVGFHMGGAVQVLFGVRGKRWDDNELLTPYYNEAWVRPSSEERPATFTSVEDGCYW